MQVDNRIVTEYGPRIGPSGLAVYLVLAKFVDPHPPARATRRLGRLPSSLGIGRRNAVKTIAMLREAGLISVQRRMTARGGADSNQYTLLELGDAAVCPR